MRNIYKITLRSPLGIRYGSMTIGRGRVTLNLFGVRNELAAERKDDTVTFGGNLRFITGSRPCVGTLTLNGRDLEGSLTLKGVTIPLNGTIDETIKEDAV